MRPLLIERDHPLRLNPYKGSQGYKLSVGHSGYQPSARKRLTTSSNERL